VVVARVAIRSVNPLRVVRLFRVVVPARLVSNRVSKRPLKVVVYTPFVTVPALPEIEPVMRLENVLLPEKVLLSARAVEEAAVIVMFCEPSKAVPLIFLGVVSVAAEPALPVTDPEIGLVAERLVKEPVVEKREVVVDCEPVALTNVKF
jgi:hypothetical protein